MTPHPVAFDGRIELTLPEGQARLEHAPADLETWFRNATGRILVHEQRVTYTEGQAGGLVPMGDPTTEEIPLTRSDVVALARAEGQFFTLRARPAGWLAVATTNEGPAEPVWAGPSATDGVRAPSPWPYDAERLAWGWQEGWPLVGDFRPEQPLPGFPAAGSRLTGAGPLVAEIEGGELRFEGPDGTGRVVDLRETREAPPTGPVHVARIRLARLELQTAALDAPLGDRWLATGPTLQWTLDGEATWREVTGTLRSNAGTRTLAGEDVTTVGRSKAMLTADGSGTRHEGDAAWTFVAIAGAPLAPAPAPLPAGPLAASAGAAALLAWVLRPSAAGRMVGLFYTRLSPGRLLDHERRRHLVDLVRAEPGLHLRELQRRAGLRWGSFSYHLQMLCAADILKTVRKDATTRVTIPGEVGPLPETGLRAAVLAALPEDGSPIAVKALHERLGVSRQLLRYHLDRLAAQGLAKEAPDRPGLAWRPLRKAPQGENDAPADG